MSSSVSLEKWVRAGQPEDVYQNHPEFVSFLAGSKILSQIKITRDQVRQNGQEAELLVEGAWTKASEVQNRFTVLDSKLYGQKFVVEKATRDVFTYLDNGRGLQKHHPFQTTNNPISKLDEVDYQKTLQVAQRFVRPEEAELSDETRKERNANRPFILQLVSSSISEGSSNLSQFIRSPKHPYIRVIVGVDNPDIGTKKGDVYEVGFGWKGQPLVPFSTTQGRFSSPDVWEYKPADKRIVTNIAISQQEAKNIREFTLKYHLDSIHLGNEPAFHLLKQNCSVFFREACNAANITVPTQISVANVIERIAPDWIRHTAEFICTSINKAVSLIRRFIQWITPEFISKGIAVVWKKIHKISLAALKALSAFILVPTRALLGGFFGKGGRAFNQNSDARLKPPLHSLKNYFSLPKLNFPAIVQEWQSKQTSTIIYEDPVKLTIVPPDSAIEPVVISSRAPSSIDEPESTIWNSAYKAFSRQVPYFFV